MRALKRPHQAYLMCPSTEDTIEGYRSIVSFDSWLVKQTSDGCMKGPNFFVSARCKGSNYLTAPVRAGDGFGDRRPEDRGNRGPVVTSRTYCRQVGGRRALRLNMAGKVMITCLCVLGLVLAGGRRAAASSIAITTPANGATVRGAATIVTSQTPDVGWVTVFVDTTVVGWSWNMGAPVSVVTWNSATVPDGRHAIGVAGYGLTGAMVAAASIAVTVQNSGGLPPPIPSPTPGIPTVSPKLIGPTPLPTAASPGVTSYPLPDAAAAAKVVLNPGFEPRPENYHANHSVPTVAQLALVGSLGFLDSHGNTLLNQATGNYTGTTDEILQWAAYKWGFDPDITRANAVTETHWHQYDIGDVGNGVSLGILQIKSADDTGTCDPVSLAGGDISLVTNPSCLSYNYTAFAADYKLAYQRACMDGSVTYFASQTPAARLSQLHQRDGHDTHVGLYRGLVQRQLV